MINYFVPAPQEMRLALLLPLSHVWFLHILAAYCCAAFLKLQ